ncbi:LysR substrate-binding domain-containing protein [Brenneria rubrifaciens]|uniref:LysR family transcriptional regulator n=1 Tax=Brenneria rubrifaciens TaxID=55213 RepID=A0A4P8QRZ3_9GAMM|nr:LysR substrate-binding domain-containing protein [Brenneria rubrifaciens]QCR09808.1 LysR family transcriptional regulator [Brenneria rubrifaciens]
MNLRQIEVFKAVMNTGTISDASRLLHVSVPAVSRVLSHTESRLGFLLFERIKGRLYPTAEGRRLFIEIEEVYKGVKRIEELSHELAERRHGFLSVVASPSIGQTVLPMALSDFHQGNPKVRVHFNCLSYDLLKEHLLTNQVEIGVSILPVDHPNLHAIPIAQSRLLCVCPKDHELAKNKYITQSDFIENQLISYSPNTPFGVKITKWFAEANVVPVISLEVGSPYNALSLVKMGAGIAIVDEFTMVGNLTEDIAVVELASNERIVADLTYLRSTSISSVGASFVTSLKKVLVEHHLIYQQTR